MKSGRNNYYAWLICFGCLMAEVVVVGLVCNLLGSYFPYMQRELGFSNTQTSSLLTVRSVANGLFAFLLKKYYDKLDVRAGLSLIVFTAGLAFAALSVNRSYIISVLLVSVLGATVSLGGIYGVTLILIRWFRTGSTTAISIAACGSGVCTMIVSPILTSALESGGLAAGFRLAAGISLASALFIALILRNAPAEPSLAWGGSGAGSEESAADAGARAVSSASDSGSSRRSPARFWIILAVLLGCTASNCTTAHFALLLEEKGCAPGMVALGISVLGIALIITKFSYGAAADRFGGRTVNLVCCALGFAGEFMLAVIGAGSIVLIGLALIMTCYGLIVASLGTPVLARDLYGEDDFSSILKDLQAWPVLGPVLLGTAPGFIADLTGSYVPSYLAFAAMLLLAGIIYFFCYRYAAGKE